MLSQNVQEQNGYEVAQCLSIWNFNKKHFNSITTRVEHRRLDHETVEILQQNIYGQNDYKLVVGFL